MQIWMVIPILLGIIAILVILTGTATRCPDCKKWWARGFESQQKKDRKESFKTINNIDEINNDKGEVTETIKKTEEIRKITETKEKTWKCRHCEHIWARVKEKTHEG